MGVQVYPGRFAALLLVSLAASTVRAAPADAAASAKCSPFTVKPGTSVSKQTHLSKMWTPDGASHPQDVSSYAPICAQEHSSILNMARSALLSAGKGKNTALIVGANVGRSNSDFVFDGLRKLPQTRKRSLWSPCRPSTCS